MVTRRKGGCATVRPGQSPSRRPYLRVGPTPVTYGLTARKPSTNGITGNGGSSCEVQASSFRRRPTGLARTIEAKEPGWNRGGASKLRERWSE